MYKHEAPQAGRNNSALRIAPRVGSLAAGGARGETAPVSPESEVRNLAAQVWQAADAVISRTDYPNKTFEPVAMAGTDQHRESVVLPDSRHPSVQVAGLFSDEGAEARLRGVGVTEQLPPYDDSGFEERHVSVTPDGVSVSGTDARGGTVKITDPSQQRTVLSAVLGRLK